MRIPPRVHVVQQLPFRSCMHWICRRRRGHYTTTTTTTKRAMMVQMVDNVHIDCFPHISFLFSKGSQWTLLCCMCQGMWLHPHLPCSASLFVHGWTFVKICNRVINGLQGFFFCFIGVDRPYVLLFQNCFLSYFSFYVFACNPPARRLQKCLKHYTYE